MSYSKKAILTIVIVTVLITAILYLIPAKQLTTDLISKVRSYDALAPVAYYFFFLIAAVSGISRSLMTIIAGVLFSPVVAFTVVMLGLMSAFLVTFIMARYFAADWVAARMEKVSTAKALMSAVEKRGFRLLVLMRLNPFVPGVVNGYGFGMTSISLKDYLLASLLGSLPLTAIYIYLGWAGGESVLQSGSATQDVQNGTLIVGVVFSVILLLGISWYGHRAVASARKSEE